MTQTISTQALIDAFQANDMATTFEGKKFIDVLAELGIKDLDGLMEYLIARLDTQAPNADATSEELGNYLDGIAGGVRATLNVLGKANSS